MSRRDEPGSLERSILDALEQGWLVLDEALQLAQPGSAVTCRLLRRELPAGTTLSDALAAWPDPAVVTTAVQMARAALEAARPEEERAAMRDLSLSSPGGGPHSLAWYDVQFRLLAVAGEARRVLIAFHDVTARRHAEIQATQTRAAYDLAVAVMRAEPYSLQLFLDTASASMSLVNSLLRMPARSEAAFRQKLERILAEMHALADEADGLRLHSVVESARVFAALLAGLAMRETLTGDDLLPLAPRLDELFGHIGAISALQEDRASVAAMPSAADRPASAAGRAGGDSEDHLRHLVERLTSEYERDVSLLVLGLANVPAAYRHSIDNMLAHLVRNAVEHGIETREARAATGKQPAGTVIVEFSATPNGYELMVQDDGQGFDVERIGRVAIERGLITRETLATTDPRKLVGLIFRPGFSTAGVADVEGSGRGLGMEFLRELVTRLGGSISVATKRGRYTRFKVSLPQTAADEDDAAAVA